MTKIAIISQAEQGVLIDISGCSSLTEAKQYLTSTLQVSSQFWEGLIVDLNLGPLVLTPEQVSEIQAIVSECGVQPRQIFSQSPITRASIIQCRLPLGSVQVHGPAVMPQTASSPSAVSHSAVPPGSLAKSAISQVVMAPTLEFLSQEVIALSGLPSNRASESIHQSIEPAFQQVDPIVRQSEQSRSDTLVLQAAGVSAANVEIPAMTGMQTSGYYSSGQGYSGGDFAAAETTVDSELPGFTVVSFSGDASCMKDASSSSVHQSGAELVDTASGAGVAPGQSSKILRTRMIAAGHESAPASAASPARAAVAPSSTSMGAPASPTSAAPSKQFSSGKTQAPAVLLMKQTLRSGQHVSHKGHLVVIGDVNPGAEIVADGDITVWGALRGMAHAGASGNTSAEIRALKFEPLQLRIAHAIARSPDRSKGNSVMSSGPETARIVDGKIRIAASDPE